jgi:hypothetical protein
MRNSKTTTKLPRRTFLAGAAAGAVTLMKPAVVRGTQANSMIELGLIGCGGRGNWITNLFHQTLKPDLEGVKA